MRRTQLSARTHVIISTGTLTLHQAPFNGTGSEQVIVLNELSAKALLPHLQKFVAGHKGDRAPNGQRTTPTGARVRRRD